MPDKAMPDPIGLELFRLSESIMYGPAKKTRLVDELDPENANSAIRAELGYITLEATVRPRRYGTTLGELNIALAGEGVSEVKLSMERDRLPVYDFSGDSFVGIFTHSLRQHVNNIENARIA